MSTEPQQRPQGKEDNEEVLRTWTGMVAQLHPSRSCIGAACAFAMAHREPALVSALLRTVAARLADTRAPRAALLACLYLVDALFKHECDADGATPPPGTFRAAPDTRALLAALAAAAPPAETRRVLAIWQDKGVVPAALCAPAAARLAQRSAAPPASHDSPDDLAGLLSSPDASPEHAPAASGASGGGGGGAGGAVSPARYKAQLERVQREFRAAQTGFDRSLTVPAAEARLRDAQTRFFYALWSTVPAAEVPQRLREVPHGVCRARDDEGLGVEGAPSGRQRCRSTGRGRAAEGVM